jgi:hypothetical protein
MWSILFPLVDQSRTDHFAPHARITLSYIARGTCESHSFSPPFPQIPRSSSSASEPRMSDIGSKEKAYTTDTSSVDGRAADTFYDPSKESIWTRLGLSPESFKRAPGVTGYVVLQQPFSSAAF